MTKEWESWIIVDVHTSPGGAPSMNEDASSTVEAMGEEVKIQNRNRS